MPFVQEEMRAAALCPPNRWPERGKAADTKMQRPMRIILDQETQLDQSFATTWTKHRRLPRKRFGHPDCVESEGFYSVGKFLYKAGLIEQGFPMGKPAGNPSSKRAPENKQASHDKSGLSSSGSISPRPTRPANIEHRSYWLSGSLNITMSIRLALR